MFFYSETAPRSATAINIWKMNGTKAYMRHYDQLMFLRFMAANGTQRERWQAEKEIVICHKKLKFWEKHPNTDLEAIRRGVEDVNKTWKMPVT